MTGITIEVPDFSLIVLIEHGAITMPSVWNDPDEIDAPISPIG